MTVNAQRTAIKAKMETVDGIGIVHGFQRYAKRQQDLRELYEQDGTLLGWYITRRNSDERVHHALANEALTRWEIVGYRTIKDEDQSEILFDNLIEAIRTAFRNDQTLGGVVSSTRYQDRTGIQVDSVEPVMFAGVLCHMAVLSLITLADGDTFETVEDAFTQLHVDWDVPTFGNVSTDLPADEADAQDIIEPEQE